MTTTEELVNKKGLRIEVKDPEIPGSPWIVTLKMRGRRMTVPFWLKGKEETFKAPEASVILDYLFSDVEACSGSFENFCAELDCNPDSRRAEHIFKACQKTTKKLKTFLAEDFDKFMKAER